MNAILKQTEPLHGIAYGLDAEVYFAQPHLSNSGIKELLKSPAHFIYSLTEKREQTKAMQIGSAVHCAVLEPSEFGKRYIEAPVIDKRTNAGKDAWKVLEASGKEVLSAEDYRLVMELTAAVNQHPTAVDLISEGKPEVSVFGEVGGVLAKCRFDWLRPDGIAADLKTTDSAYAHDFARSVGKFGYHRQAAWYQLVADSVGIDIHTFIFIAVEKSAPYGVSVFELDGDSLELGRQQIACAVALYKHCNEFNEWPSYEPGIQKIRVPAWTFYDNQE